MARRNLENNKKYFEKQFTFSTVRKIYLKPEQWPMSQWVMTLYQDALFIGTQSKHILQNRKDCICNLTATVYIVIYCIIVSNRCGSLKHFLTHRPTVHVLII